MISVMLLPPTIRSLDFATITSHQLRTPLTAIKWYLDLLVSKKAGPLNDQQMDFLSEMYHANERMIRLVDDLTLVSDIDSGRFAIHPSHTEMCDLIESVLGEYRLFASAYNITLVHQCDRHHAKTPAAMVDPIFIRMCLKNLIDNAVRYSLKGGSVVVNCEQSREHGIVVSVSDSGVGIPESERKNIFMKFFRSASVIEMQTEGTGLGLYIVKSVIEKHGGRVWFESGETHGTTFYFSIPAAPDNQMGGNNGVEEEKSGG